jgi:hypothetical protein
MRAGWRAGVSGRDSAVTKGTNMKTAGVAEAATLLHDFQFVDPTWYGTAFVPCWGNELEVYISPEESVISARQLAVLRAFLSYPRDLRPEFERALFDYYQAEVDGSYCSYDPQGKPIPGSGPPKLTDPAQVWSLIDGPEVYIPTYFRTESSIEFELSFVCEWDPEHGLGVLYRDWQPVKFGGWDL